MEPDRVVEDTACADQAETRSEEVVALSGKKRPPENQEDDELEAPKQKKPRNGGELVWNVKKVAEIVMVLAAMGRMRGGRSPTAAEREMMAEAREKLVEVCKGFAPKDVFPRDVFGVVIEDLGLSKPKEQRLGFRPPKMSIGEKLLLTKQKMEQSRELSSHPAKHSSQRLQKNLGPAAERSSASHATKMFPSDKPNSAVISSGGLQQSSAFGHVSAASSTSLSYQLPASEVRTSMVSNGLLTTLPGWDSSSPALPRAERPHFRMDLRSDSSAYSSHVQANSSGNHTWQKTPSSSQQSQSGLSAKTGADNKTLLLPPVKVEGTIKLGGTADITTLRMNPHAGTSKPLITQAVSGNLQHQHVQGPNFLQAPLLSSAHSEIGKIIQKLLQPQLPEHPTWTTPSRDYMNKALSCQVCKLMINDVESVLVCDACEKGYHLKCLQSLNQKGIPRGEWHCFKCLSLSNWKPLPPKYGRVTRNITAPKALSNTASVQSSPQKVGALSEKGNQQQTTENGSSGLENSPAASRGINHNHSIIGSNMENTREMQRCDILSSKEEMDDKGHIESCPNGVIRMSDPASISSAACSSSQASSEDILDSKIGGQPLAKLSGEVDKILDHLQPSSNPQENNQKGLRNDTGIPSKQRLDSNHMVKDPEESESSRAFNGKANGYIRREEHRVAQSEPVYTSGTSILVNEHANSSLDGTNNVEWIGERLRVEDEKIYYSSCCIKGVVYNVTDYALFRSNNGNIMPSKLMAMWEDNKTRTKWVMVNRCYFPSDLPETVGRPCSLESNEVYESNHGSIMLVGLIQGPCEVLPSGRFMQESERRSHLGSEVHTGLQPLFLCKWFYDESKGVFRDVSS